MNVNDKRAALIHRYSPVIRGQRVDMMTDEQVCAIYGRLLDRNDLDTCKPRIPKKDRLHEPVKYEQMRMEF